MTAIIREERIGNQRLILGDCREVMPELGRFDAVVTDPPYGIGYVHSGGGKGKNYKSPNKRMGPTKPIIGDNRPFDPTILMQYSNMFVLWGADHYASRLWVDGTMHVWDKDPKGRLSWDSFSDAELVWTSWKRSREVMRYLWKGLCQEGGGSKRLHPTEKPLPVMEWCLGFVPDAKTILDPFMGSGTTLVACQRMGRFGTGIELDPDYFDIACRRVDEAARQPDLLIPETRPQPVQQGLDI